MNRLKHIRIILFALLSSIVLSCGSNRIKGTASDRTGTNGATNGTGKIAKSL